MALLNWEDRVQELSISIGLGPFVLAGAEPGYQTFLSASVTECVLTIEEIDSQGQPNGQWETLRASISGVNVTRGPTRSSSNAGSPVTFAAGDKRVMLVADARSFRSAPTKDDKNLVALVTVADGDQATSALTHTPAFKGYVQVLYNSIQLVIGDGTKVGVPAYWSNDGGTTARALDALEAGDTLHWNGTVATLQLVGTDRFNFNYVAQG